MNRRTTKTPKPVFLPVEEALDKPVKAALDAALDAAIDELAKDDSPGRLEGEIQDPIEVINLGRRPQSLGWGVIKEGKLYLLGTTEREALLNLGKGLISLTSSS